MLKKTFYSLITLQFLIISTTPIVNRPPDNVCVTPSCREAAELIMKDMDVTVDPCDNFYEFACGKFINTTDIPDDKDIISYDDKLEEKIERELKTSLEASSLPNEPRFFELAKSLYKTCMNNDSTFGNKSRYLMLEHIKKAGGWPVLEGDKWNESNFNWIESTYYFSDMGFDVDYFMELEIDLNTINNTEHIIELSQDSSRIIEQNYSINYLNYMVDIAEYLGADPIQARKELLESVLFEISLLNITLFYKNEDNEAYLSTEELSDSFDNETIIDALTIEEMSEQYPSINWKEYINRMLMSTVEIQEDDLIFGNTSFLSDRLELIENTPNRTLANYIMSKIMLKSAKFLDEKIRNRTEKFNKAVDGKEKKKSARWKDCVSYISECYKLGIGAIYVRDHFQKSNKQDTVKIVTDIQDQFMKNLADTEWMDEITKKNAVEKLASMTNQIAYPDEFLNDTILNEYYMDLELSHDNYLQASLNLTTFNRKKLYQKLRIPFNKTEWVNYVDTIDVNAFNDRPKNTMIIPAATLQGLYINNDRPRYMDYSAIGWVIGHEISHSFDSSGSENDKDGNERNWWNSTTAEQFHNKSQCYIDQYSNYTTEGVNMNGTLTLDEDIADNGGTKVAYLAYKNWSIKNTKEQKLPGLCYTPLQMFWINAATMWCTKFRPGQQKKVSTSDEHSLPQFRIIGSFSNSPEFSQDFNCPPNSKMNRQDKCSLW